VTKLPFPRSGDGPVRREGQIVAIAAAALEDRRHG
jgi:hypothetical protein